MLGVKDKDYYDRFFQRLTVHPDHTLPVEIRRFQKCILQINCEEMRILNTKKVKALLKTKLRLPSSAVERLTKGVMDDGNIVDCSCNRGKACAPAEVLQEINELGSVCNRAKGVYCMNVYPSQNRPKPQEFQTLVLEWGNEKEDEGGREEGKEEGEEEDEEEEEEEEEEEGEGKEKKEGERKKERGNKENLEKNEEKEDKTKKEEETNQENGAGVREESMEMTNAVPLSRSFLGEGDADLEFAEEQREGRRCSTPSKLRPRKLSFSTPTPVNDDKGGDKRSNEDASPPLPYTPDSEDSEDGERGERSGACPPPTSCNPHSSGGEQKDAVRMEDCEDSDKENITSGVGKGGSEGDDSCSQSDSTSPYLDESLSEDSTTAGVKENVRRHVDEGRAKAILVTKKDKAEAVDGLIEDFLTIVKHKTTFASITIEDDEDVLSECEFEGKLINTLKVHEAPLSCQVNVRQNEVLRSLTCYHNPATPIKPLRALIDAWQCIHPDMPNIKHMHLTN